GTPRGPRRNLPHRGAPHATHTRRAWQRGPHTQPTRGHEGRGQKARGSVGYLECAARATIAHRGQTPSSRRSSSGRPRPPGEGHTHTPAVDSRPAARLCHPRALTVLPRPVDTPSAPSRLDDIARGALLGATAGAGAALLDVASTILWLSTPSDQLRASLAL